MMDYVWDYGTLNEKDEITYISSIMSAAFPNPSADLISLLVKTVHFSQKCIRMLLFDI